MGNDGAADRGGYPVRVEFTDESGEKKYLSIDLTESIRIVLRFPGGHSAFFSWRQAMQLNAGMAQAVAVLLSRSTETDQDDDAP